jgi:type IV pilus assembly protein PilM
MSEIGTWETTRVSARFIGLDIGSSALRAAELTRVRDRFELLRFGQLSLPDKAVVEGEIQDPEVVAGTLRDLWANVGFTTKNVVLGLNSQKLVVRTIDVPDIPNKDELESAVKFEALEQIPIPIEDALLDFEIIGRIPAHDDEDEKIRALVAAIPVEITSSYLAAAHLAGLHVEALDPGPFALVRALRAQQELNSNYDLEAVVCLGNSLTSVVLHDPDGLQFVRVLASGTGDIRNALRDTHGLDEDLAEAMMRTVSSGDVNGFDPHVIDTLNRSIAPLVDDVRGSLDFYTAQEDSRHISHLVLMGGGSRVRGISDRLKREINVDVEVAHPLLNMSVGKNIGFDSGTLATLEPVMVPAMGHAFWSLPVEKGQRRINLLPSQARLSEVHRRQNRTAAAIMLLLALLLGASWFWAHMRASGVRDKIASTRGEVANLTAQKSKLHKVETLQTTQQNKLAYEASLLTGDVSWTRLIKELAAVMPSRVSLTTLQLQKGLPWTMTVVGTAQNEHDVADWLDGLKKLPWVADSWVSNISKQGDSPVLQFNSQATLDPHGESDRLERRKTAGQP